MIIRRTLESVQQSRDGSVLASFLAVDDKGIEWRRSRSRFPSEIEAQIALRNFDWSPQLRQKQLADAQEDIEAGKLNSLNTEDFKKQLIARLVEVRNNLNFYTTIRDRLQIALDRVNG